MPDTGDDERDYWQEYKDDLAMGYINEDGTQRDEPGEPNWDADYEDTATRNADWREEDRDA